MAQNETLKVNGLKELLQATARADKETKRYVRAVLRKTGESVKTGAAERFASTDARSASRYRVVVRQRGIAVEQSLRKTTGLHPEFGALQMRRALVPSLEANEAKTEADFEHALDLVCEHFNGTSI